MGINHETPYPTIKHMVYLGHVTKSVRDRAKLAGLAPVTAKQYIKILDRMSAAGRMIHEGRWFDTVRY